MDKHAWLIGGSVGGKTPSLMLKQQQQQQQHNSKVKNRIDPVKPPSLLYAIGFFFLDFFASFRLVVALPMVEGKAEAW